jgi:hypothetical protein
MIISNDQKRLERRYQAGRPYHRKPVNRHQVSSKEDYIAALAITFAVGAMLGATIALGVLS